MSASFQHAGTYVPDNLIASNADLLLSEKIMLAAGQNLKRGALLGKVTVGGKYVLSLAAASDGSQVPRRLLVEDTDATTADKEALGYRRGDFNDFAVTFGAGHTAASVAEGLADMNIFILTAQGGV